MSADDKVAISFDANGIPAGTMNISEIQRYQRLVAKTVVLGIGKDHDDYLSDLMAVGKGRDEMEKYLALVAAVTNLAEIVGSMLTLLDAMGVEGRAKLREVYEEQS